jgi:hypothetical protein
MVMTINLFYGIPGIHCSNRSQNTHLTRLKGLQKSSSIRDGTCEAWYTHSFRFVKQPFTDFIPHEGPRGWEGKLTTRLTIEIVTDDQFSQRTRWVKLPFIPRGGDCTYNKLFHLQPPLYRLPPQL